MHSTNPIFRRSVFMLAAITLFASGVSAEVQEAKPTRIVVIGDCVAAGSGGKPSDSYPALLESRLNATGLQVQVTNLAVAEDRITRVIPKMDRDILARKPDVVLIQLGGTDSRIDAGKSYPLVVKEIFQANLRVLIHRIQSQGAKVVLVSPTPHASDAKGQKYLTGDYAQFAAEVAREQHVGFVDAFGVLSQAATQSDSTNALYVDARNLNLAGHQLLVEQIAPVVRDTLNPPTADSTERAIPVEPAKPIQPMRVTLQSAELSPLPDAEGFAGSFAGVVDGQLIVAGGSNFPDKKPWEGGSRVGYSSIYRFDGKTWTLDPLELPRAMAYGASVSDEKGLICIGGSGANETSAECFRIVSRDGKLAIEPLPSLAYPTMLHSAVVVGHTVYVAGGIDSADASIAMNYFWSLDLSDKNAQWQTLTSWPGTERVQAVMAAVDGKVFLFGGIAIEPNIDDGTPVRVSPYLRDAYCYTPGQGWEKLPELPRGVAAAPSPAMTITQPGESEIAIIGGLDAKPDSSNLDAPLSTASVLCFNTSTKQWTERPTLGKDQGRTTAPAVTYNGQYLIIGGERTPGRRSNQVITITSTHEATDK